MGRYAWLALFALCVSAFEASAATCPAPDVLPAAAKPFHRVAPYINRYPDRLDEINRRAAAERFDVVFIGDSIVMRWPDATLQSAIGRKTLNAGIGGDTAAALLWRLQNGTWPTDTPVVIVLVGTNDGGRNAPCDVFVGIEAVVAKVHTVFPKAKVLVVSILPRGPNMRGREQDIATTNAALREAQSQDKFQFVDAHDAFLCNYQSDCPLMKPPTNVHPTAEGYRVLGEILQKAVAAQ